MQYTHCGTSTRAAYNGTKIPSSAFGPCLTAKVALLTRAYHLSRRKTQRLLSELFGITVSLGAISAMAQRASEALASARDESLREVQICRRQTLRRHDVDARRQADVAVDDGLGGGDALSHLRRRVQWFRCMGRKLPAFRPVQSATFPEGAADSAATDAQVQVQATNRFRRYSPLAKPATNALESALSPKTASPGPTSIGLEHETSMSRLNTAVRNG